MVRVRKDVSEQQFGAGTMSIEQEINEGLNEITTYIVSIQRRAFGQNRRIIHGALVKPMVALLLVP